MNIETDLHKYRVFTHAEPLYSLHRIYRIVTAECGVQRHEFIREVATANNPVRKIDVLLKEAINCREINEKDENIEKVDKVFRKIIIRQHMQKDACSFILDMWGILEDYKYNVKSVHETFDVLYDITANKFMQIYNKRQDE